MPANQSWPCMFSRRPRPALRARPHKRRGVAAVLAMMFLIMFGSLSAAMAIASRGNILAAATHLHTNRAHSAAETGLRIAQSRLAEASARFLMTNSNITGSFSWELWRGNTSGFSTFQVVPGKTGRQDLGDPAGLAAAMVEAHNLDQNIVAAVGVSAAAIVNAPAAASTSEYQATHWVQTPAVAIEAPSGSVDPLCYAVTYAPLANGTDVRVIVTGYDFSYTRNGQPVTRTLTQDFRLGKRVQHAIISPTRVMIGKNVQVQGDLGVRYNDVAFNYGDPLTARSDFHGLEPTLDNKLDFYYAQVKVRDVDGDNRLRVNHPTESTGISSATVDYQNATGNTDSPYGDVTGDGYVEEYDIFIDHFDSNNDGRVSQAEFTTGGGQSIDADLFQLIDASNPDRNRNGSYGFIDTNGDGLRQSGELFIDVDTVTSLARDQVLGYLDGYLDKRDRYVKVDGQLTFRADKNDWETNQGAVSDKVLGAIRPNEGRTAQTYNATDEQLPDLTTNVFSTQQTTLQAAADGGDLASQTSSPSQVPGASSPVVEPLQPDTDNDALPDNYTTAYFEKMPFNSPNFTDYYYRPVYKNIVFRDMEIPAGTNALFENCWFIGVTWIHVDTNNTHTLWSEYGKLKMTASDTRPRLAIARVIYGDDTGETSYPTMLPASATPPNQMILMANPPMDKADIAANQVAYVQGYDNLPDPLVIGGNRIVDTKLYSNNLRFHDCLIVGSIVSDAPQNYTQSRNKIQFTGTTRFVEQNPDYPTTTNMNPEEDDKEEIEKSSLMLPNMSVDIGSFNSPASQNVQLQGAIIAGVLDVRGNTDITGALLLTFAPSLGQGPLQDALGNPIGNPAAFNTTIGYFGPDDGDNESLDPSTLPIFNGQRIVGWDTNGDGLSDVPSDQPQPGGSTAVPFYGYGRVHLRFDQDMKLPDGIMLPLSYEPRYESYKEGKPW